VRSESGSGSSRPKASEPAARDAVEDEALEGAGERGSERVVESVHVGDPSGDEGTEVREELDDGLLGLGQRPVHLGLALPLAAALQLGFRCFVLGSGLP